jgi:hypothetical protein
VLLEYVLDLRFVDIPRQLRHVSWRWITFSLVFLALALGSPRGSTPQRRRGGSTIGFRCVSPSLGCGHSQRS